MPLDTTEINFDAERDRLREQMEEIADEQVKWEDDEEKAQQLLIQGNQLNNQINILDRLEDEWGVESVTLAGLTAGEVNLVEDTVEENAGVRERDAWVAIGTHDAPYLAHDPENVAKADFRETVQNVTDLPLAYVRWAEGKVSELSHLSEATGNEYLELVQAKQADATSETTNG